LLRQRSWYKQPPGRQCVTVPISVVSYCLLCTCSTPSNERVAPIWDYARFVSVLLAHARALLLTTRPVPLAWDESVAEDVGMLSHLRSLPLFRQEIMLPWYTDFANQYLAQPYGSEWKGNFTLLHTYEKAA
jgi:hypothetical protein